MVGFVPSGNEPGRHDDFIAGTRDRMSESFQRPPITRPPLEPEEHDSAYEGRKKQLLRAFNQAVRAGEPVRLRKPTSNLFRARKADSRYSLDVRAFNHVLRVDPTEGWADVEGMIPYEAAADALLPHGFMPAVVPELKSITVGGAISGGGIESSSFRYGFVHETVREMEILTGTGECVLCRPDNEHRDLFFGFPCSYGSLGYCLRARIRIVPTKPYVHLRHLRYSEIDTYFRDLEQLCRENRGHDAATAFIDGSVFSESELFITIGKWTDEASLVSDYTGMRIYHRSIREKEEDWLSVRDYLWRWDTDWFWCSRAFGAENPAIRRLYHHLGLLRSTSYWKMKALAERSGLLKVLGKERNVEYVIQDVEIPAENAPEFLRFMLREIGLLPIWICPAGSPDPAARFSLYPTDPTLLYINFGFWGGVPSDQARGHYDRLVERKVIELDGKKSLYSTSYYDRETFRKVYGGNACDELKKRYDPDNRFPDRFEKCVRGG